MTRATEADVEKARAWIEKHGVTAGYRPNLATRLAELLAEVRAECLETLAKQVSLGLERRDDNDGSTYCCDCGETLHGTGLGHDDECVVEVIRSGP